MEQEDRSTYEIRYQADADVKTKRNKNRLIDRKEMSNMRRDRRFDRTYVDIQKTKNRMKIKKILDKRKEEDKKI